MSSQPVQSFPDPKPEKEVAKISQAAARKTRSHSRRNEGDLIIPEKEVAKSSQAAARKTRSHSRRKEEDLIIPEKKVAKSSQAAAGKMRTHCRRNKGGLIILEKEVAKSSQAAAGETRTHSRRNEGDLIISEKEVAKSSQAAAGETRTHSRRNEGDLIISEKEVAKSSQAAAGETLAHSRRNEGDLIIPEKEVAKSSQAAAGETRMHSRRNEGNLLMNFSTGDHNTLTNSSHMIPSRPVKQLSLFSETIKVSDMPQNDPSTPVKQLNLFNETIKVSDVPQNDPSRPVKQLSLFNEIISDVPQNDPSRPVNELSLFSETVPQNDPSRPVKQLDLSLFNETIRLSDVPQNECWEIPDPRSNPPSKRVMETRPLGKEACSGSMKRDMFFASCSLGEGSGKKVNVTYSATPIKAKAAFNMQASNLVLLPPSKASAPRPPRIPSLSLELPSLQDASHPSHNKMCHVISSKAPISETDKYVPCVRRPIPMSYFNTIIIPESALGGDDGLAKRYKPDYMKSPDTQHATESVPSPREHAIKLFGKTITTMITSSEEGEEATIKHRSGKEPIASDRIRVDEVVKIKDTVVDSQWASFQMNRWIGNESRMEKRNTGVVGSGKEKVEEEKVPSAAAVAMVGRALNGAPPFQIKKMSGYSVWD